MKKILIPVAVVAIGVAAYFYQQQESEYNVLDYVPADTPFFTGQLTPFPVKDYISSTPYLIDPADQEELQALYDQDIPAFNFILNLMNTYQDSLQDADLFVKTFGLANNIRGYFYTLGLLPVLKIEVANPQAIWDLLDQNEIETGFIHKEGKINDVTYRAYPLTQPGSERPVDLVIAQAQGVLTITVNSSFVPESLLAMALGLEKPDVSLADTNMLNDIIKQHHFIDASVGFINHVEIVKGLTSSDANQLSKQLQTLEKLQGSNPFSMLQSAVCQQELTTVAENWPRSVFGYTEIDVTKNESTLAFSAVLESKNKVIIDALKALRGFIPSYVKNFENSAVAASIGLDVSQLSSSLTAIWTDLQTPMYQCLPLADMQAQISDAGESLAMIGMSANVASGVKGISAAIFDYTIDQKNNQPTLEKLDALIALHADDAETIFNSIKMFSPDLQQVQLTSNGPSISLNDIFPIPAELNFDPKLAIKGKHLLIYSGKKGTQEAEKLGSEKLASNGFYQMSFDSEKILTPLADAAALTDGLVPDDIMFLFNYDARMSMKLDINDQGIRFDSTVNTSSDNDN